MPNPVDVIMTASQLRSLMGEGRLLARLFGELGKPDFEFNGTIAAIRAHMEAVSKMLADVESKSAVVEWNAYAAEKNAKLNAASVPQAPALRARILVTLRQHQPMDAFEMDANWRSTGFEAPDGEPGKTLKDMRLAGEVTKDKQGRYCIVEGL